MIILSFIIALLLTTLIYRAVCRAVCRDDCTAIDYMGGYTASCRTFLVY